MTVSHQRPTSSAFQQALLRSERLRIPIVLGTLAVALLLRTLRTVAGGSENVSSWLITFELLGLFSIYEFGMLKAVNRSIQKGQDLGNSVWVSNIIIETCLPALGLALISSPL